MPRYIRILSVLMLLSCAVCVFSFEDGVPQDAKPYLVRVSRTDPGVVSVLQQHGIPVYFKLEQWYIAGADASQLEQFESAGIEYEVIDEEAWSNPYYIVTKPGSETLGQIPDVGEIIFQQDKEALVKIRPDQTMELAQADFHLTSVSTRPLPMIERQASKPVGRRDALRTDDVIGAIVNQVSQEILRSSVQRLQDFQTRFFASDSIDAAAEWIYDRFVDFGYADVQFQPFTDPQYGVPVRNVIATKPGILYPDSVIIIGGHYDSIVYDGSDWFVWAPGADDNASGVMGVLEAARVLADVDLDCTVKFACWTAEEVGLFGAWHYAAGAYSRGENIALYINYDMLGHLDKSDPVRDISVKRNPTAQAYADIMSDMAVQHTTLAPVQLPAGTSSDHVPFMQYGYDILYVEEADFYTYLHTAVDIIDSMDIPYFCEVVKMGLATLAAAAGPPESIPVFDPVVAFADYEVDDDNQGGSIGNGNGYIDPGETIQIFVSLMNYCDTPASNVSSRLITDDPFVNMLTNEQSYGSIPSDGLQMCQEPFLVEVSPDCPVGHFVDFTIETTMDGGSQWVSYFTMRVEQPTILYTFFRVEELTGDSDGVLDPGETVNLYLMLENIGLRLASGISTELESDDPDLTITDQEASYPDMAIDGNSENTGDPFTCTLSEEAAIHALPFVLHVSEGEGYYQTELIFHVLIGQGTVLVVPDDGNMNCLGYYTEAFSYLGMPYEVGTIGGMAKSTSATLEEYSEIIWFTGPEESNTLTENDQTALIDFLDGGGRLFLSGSLIGYDIGNTPFYRDYLRARFVSFMTMLYHLDATSSSPLMKDMDITLASTGNNAQGFAGETDPVSPAVSVFQYDRNTEEGPGLIKSSGSGGLAVETEAYKIVYFSFGLDGIEPLEDRVQVLEKMLLWFKEPGVDKGDVDGNGVINIIDALVAVNIVLGVHQGTEEELARADMNYDDGINVLDVIGVVNAILGAGGGRAKNGVSLSDI